MLMARKSRIFRDIYNAILDLIFSGAEADIKKKMREARHPKVSSPELNALARQHEAQAEALLRAIPYAPAAEVEKPSEMKEETLRYCLECCDKHSGACVKLSEEALIFYDRAGKMDESVQAKVRSIVNELAGMYDDIKPGSPEKVTALLHEADSIRKWVWDKGLELGLGSREDLIKLRDRLESFRSKVFQTAQQVLGGAVVRWCKEWCAKDIEAGVGLWKRAEQEEGYAPISREEFERRFYELTGKRCKTEWDEQGRIRRLTLI